MQNFQFSSLPFAGRALRVALLLLVVVSVISPKSQASVVSGNISARGRDTAGRPVLLGSIKRGILAQTSPQTITLTATDPDGTNTGTAQLGVVVNLTATVSAGAYSAVSWKVLGSGTGSITSSGTNGTSAVYTPPSNMPSGGTATIKAYLTSNTAVSTSYVVTLINTTPQITSVTSGYLTAGATVSVNLHGTGFVPSTVITPSVGSLQATYVSSTEITVAVTIPASATGNISFTPQNPAPGGGTGAAFQTTMQSMQLTVTAPNGVNTGTAWIGAPVTFTTTVSNSVYAQRAWNLVGPGTLTASGSNSANATYTPPATLPSGTTQVTVTASLQGYPALSTPYTMTLSNPVPTVTSVTPTQLLTGGTQQVTLTGAGFISGTTVLYNGASLPTVNMSYNKATVQVPVPANATGTQTLQVQNPGVSTGAAFTESIPATSITLTAADQDGTNTGTAELGINVTLTAAVSGTEQTGVTWSLTGAGSISSSGVYTAPAVLPGNTSVTITATLSSNPAITASYSLSIINPVPVITAASPNVVTAGLTTPVTLTGSGFVPGTAILVNGAATPATYQSASSMVAQLSPATGTTTNLAIAGQNPTPGGGTGTSFPESVVPLPAITSVTTNVLTAGATTSSVYIHGTGFVPGTVIQSNVGSLQTTYSSSSTIMAQVTIPANVTSISFTPVNPNPGGGTGAAFQAPVQAIQLTAISANGTNTGLAWMGAPVTFSTVVTNSVYAEVAWSLSGPGTLTPFGSDAANATYTPPSTLPTGSNVVTVTAYMQGYPALTTSYTMTLSNPIPTIVSATPSQLLTGGTQQVALNGAGFIPGTVVLFNGTTIPTTNLDYNDLTVQIPVAANATGTLGMQVQNPGVSSVAAFSESVVPNSIALTATDADGNNTGTAELGVTVTVTAAVTGSVQTGVTWSMTGAGSLSSSGIYTAPAALPSNTSVTITAALTSNPAITASYSLSIINPIPTITGASPYAIPQGQTTAVTLTGTGFVPTTEILVNSVSVPSTYQSANSIVAEITVGATSTGNLKVEAKSPAPGGGPGPTFPVAISSPISATAAGRLLDQTTFGPTTSLLQQVEQEGVTAWLAQQFNTPQSVLANPPTQNSTCGPDLWDCTESEWWQVVLNGNDQLRQRVALALSEIFVVSNDVVLGTGTNYYMNVLANDAFSNWYTIMNDVTLSPAMGQYLDMLNSPAPTATEIADENFARENMQLFNLGLNLLNPDGSLQVDANGNPIPAYTQAQVQAFARAFTGWTNANADGSTPTALNWTHDYNTPMVAVESQHDENPKTLLNGTVLPGGQTAEADLAGALTNVFQHQNVGPFVCKQLIEHLIRSNPGPTYVQRVANVFNNNGNGVRGDMRAVLTAIFTDGEARSGDTAPLANDGHLREPILWMAAVARALNFVNIDPNSYYYWLSGYTKTLGEEPFASPAVFNFFPPTYVVPGTSLVGPEFGLENTASVTDRLSLADRMVNNGIYEFNVDLSATSPLGQIAATQGPTALVNALSSLFLYSEMDSNTSQAIVNEISSITSIPQQVRLATYLVITSSEYKILH